MVWWCVCGGVVCVTGLLLPVSSVSLSTCDHSGVTPLSPGPPGHLAGFLKTKTDHSVSQSINKYVLPFPLHMPWGCAPGG